MGQEALCPYAPEHSTNSTMSQSNLHPPSQSSVVTHLELVCRQQPHHVEDEVVVGKGGDVAGAVKRLLVLVPERDLECMSSREQGQQQSSSMEGTSMHHTVQGGFGQCLLVLISEQSPA